MERWVPGGLGLLRDEDGIVLVRGGLPGERVDVSVSGKSRGVRRGQVLRIHQPSPARRAADCAQHPRCGGCDLLDLAFEEHAVLKASLVQDALQRGARLSPEGLARVRPVAAAPHGAGARRRARLRVDEAGRPAFFGLESHSLIPLADEGDAGCLALSPALDAALRRLPGSGLVPAGATLRGACDDRGRVALALSGVRRAEGERSARRIVDRGICAGVLLLDERDHEVFRAGDPVLRGEVAPGAPGGPYGSDPATFTQATRFGGVAIGEAVLGGLTTALTSLAEARIAELFCGAGHLTLPLLAAGARVAALEGDARAFSWLEANVAQGGWCGRASLHRCFIEGASVAARLGASAPVDALVLDPPRTGIPDFAGILRAVPAPHLVLVSCDLATGARDLRIALDRGYRLVDLLPIDAFPRTSHVEWVARLMHDDVPIRASAAH